MKVTSRVSERARKFLVSLGALISVYLFFWASINSGFRFITGDMYDGVIACVLISHWHWVFTGEQAWNLPNYFFPTSDVLGYNDGYFIFGLIAAFFRALGLNIFLAAEWTNIVIKLSGYFSMYLLLKKIHPNLLVNIGMAIIFSLALNSSSQTALHVQLFSVCFVPLMCLIMLYFFEALTSGDTKKIFFIGSGGIVFFSSWILTAYYMAFFFCLFVVSVGLLAISTQTIKRTMILCNKNYPVLIVLLVLFAISLYPFLSVYLPKLNESGGHTLDVALSNAPNPTDIINFGNGSLLWGKLFQFINDQSNLFRSGEVQLGFTPIFLITFFLAGFNLVGKYKLQNHVQRLMLMIFIASLFWLIAVMRFGTWSLWAYLYPYVPGINGVRVISRFYIFLFFPMSLVIAHYLKTKLKGHKALSFILLCLLMMEQINLLPYNHLNVASEMEFLTRLQPKPQVCKSFYIKGSAKNAYLSIGQGSSYHYNVLAMLIADDINLPTINGISTFNPPDWNFAYLPAHTYEDRIEVYANIHKLVGLCRYDVSTNQWKLEGS